MKKTAKVFVAILLVFAVISGNAEMVEAHKLTKKTISLEAKTSKTLSIIT